MNIIVYAHTHTHTHTHTLTHMYAHAHSHTYACIAHVHLIFLLCSFLISVFFTNANVAACLAGLSYYLIQFGTIILVARQNSLQFPLVVLTVS